MPCPIFPKKVYSVLFPAGTLPREEVSGEESCPTSSCPVPLRLDDKYKDKEDKDKEDCKMHQEDLDRIYAWSQVWKTKFNEERKQNNSTRPPLTCSLWYQQIWKIIEINECCTIMSPQKKVLIARHILPTNIKVSSYNTDEYSMKSWY